MMFIDQDHTSQIWEMQVPHLGWGFADNRGMRHPPRKTLADNLSRLMAYHKGIGDGLGTLEGVVAASKVPRGTVHRIKRGEVSAGVDHLEGLAVAFDLDVWQLFVHDLDPTNPPMLKAITDKQKAMFDKIREYAKELEKLDSD